MPSDEGVSWPPTDISGALARMRADSASPYWELVQRQVLAYARALRTRHGNPYDEPDDITQEVMVILATPGKLEAFGYPKALVEDHVCPSERNLILQRAFLAWLAQITRRVWLGRNRYWQARLEGQDTIQPLRPASPGPVPEEGAEDPRDPRADVPTQVLCARMLEAVQALLKDLQQQSPKDAVKVRCFVLSAIHDIPQQEIAQQFGCTQREVGHAVFAIRRRLLKERQWQELQSQPGPTGPASVRPRSAESRRRRVGLRSGTTGRRDSRPPKRPTTKRPLVLQRHLADQGP